jgi:hypothetical protein
MFGDGFSTTQVGTLQKCEQAHRDESFKLRQEF